MLGKIYKYEFMALARKLVSVLIVSVVVSLGLGFVVSVFLNQEFCEVNVTNGIMETEGVMIMMHFTIIVIIFLCITISCIEKRFAKGLLSDEGYLNLSLPVKIETQILGRYLSGMTWCLIMYAGVILSVVVYSCPFLIYYDGNSFIQEIIDNSYLKGLMNPLDGIISSINFIFLIFLIISLAYMVHAVKNVSKKHPKLISAVLVIAGIIFYLIIGFWLAELSMTNKITNCVVVTIYKLVLIVINYFVTYFIFEKKLNLE